MPEHMTNLLKANKRASPKKKKEKEKIDSEEEGSKDQENGGNAKIQSISNGKKVSKKVEAGQAHAEANAVKDHLDKARLEQMSRFYLIDLDGEMDKASYNSIQRIQELMMLETNHIDKVELSR